MLFKERIAIYCENHEKNPQIISVGRIQSIFCVILVATTGQG
jgi:hypothetical protein